MIFHFIKKPTDIPAAYLQYPIYQLNRPQYMNYGGIGWTIGHEITHIFGNDISVLDEDRRNCLIDQYSSYVIKSINKNVNGTSTLKENISDNIGVKMAYKTYKNYVRFVGEELKLPGLDYTPEQLFWISGAQVYCSDFGVNSLKKIHQASLHTVDFWRILGTFRNMVDFSNDFKCSETAKMNPLKKCELWK